MDTLPANRQMLAFSTEMVLTLKRNQRAHADSRSLHLTRIFSGT